MKQKTTTWRKELKKAMKLNNETWADVESCTLTEADLDEAFILSPASQATEGKSFTLWTKENIYFLAEHNGVQSVAQVSRHPNGRATRIDGW